MPTNLVLSSEHSALCLHEFTGYWKKPKKIRTLEGLSCGFLEILGSCNGLVCFSEFIHGHRDTEKEFDVRNLARKLYVSNPLLGEYILLPQPRRVENVSRDWYGFGFCAKSKHYKVIRIFVREENLGKSEAEICTVGVDGNWRVLSQDAPVPCAAVASWNRLLIRNDTCDVLFGRVHWITDDNSKPGFIYSFDIGEEKVQRVPQPCEMQRSHRTMLGVLHDCLCVFQLCSCSWTLDIWWMMEYNEVESWTKQSIVSWYLGDAMDVGIYHPIVLLGTKEMVISSDYGPLISYDMEKDILTTLGSKGTISEGCKGGSRCFSAVPYVPCFLSLKIVLAGKLEGVQGHLDFVADLARGKVISRNNQRAADVTTILDLPRFILEYIFLRMPKYSIGSLRRVCKIWYNFISSPAFGHAFFTAQHLVLSENYTCSLLELNLDHDCDHKNFIGAPKQLSFKKPKVLGSCNGLICFSTSFDSKNKGLCICNPLMRQCARLPDPPGVDKVTEETYGFGFSPAAGQYKILRVLTTKWAPHLEAHVCTVGSDGGWRNLGRLSVDPILDDWSKKTNQARLCEATLNGALHWIAESKESYLIYSFDMSEERVHLIPPPPCTKSRYGTNLGVLRDCLCVFQLGWSMDLHIWKMDRYGDGNSWNRESISTNSIPRGPRNRTVLPILTHKAGVLLMYADSGPLVSWSPKEKRFNIVKIDPGMDGCRNAIQHFPSFLSLKALSGQANWCWRMCIISFGSSGSKLL